MQHPSFIGFRNNIIPLRIKYKLYFDVWHPDRFLNNSRGSTHRSKLISDSSSLSNNAAAFIYRAEGQTGSRRASVEFCTGPTRGAPPPHL